MFNLLKFKVLRNSLTNGSFIFPGVVCLLLITSCTPYPEPYTIFEFSDLENVSNYSKSLLLSFNESDSIHPVPVLGSRGDLFMTGDFLFSAGDTSATNSFTIRYTDSVLFVNGKISALAIPEKDEMIPWLENLKDGDLSSLQCINLDSASIRIYENQLNRLARIRPDLGLVFDGGINEMTELFRKFNPVFIARPTLFQQDYHLLTGLSNLEILIIVPGDSLIVDPLPPLPALKQLFLTEVNSDAVISDNLLKNNGQIERIAIQKKGKIDLSLLQPVEHLKELVIRDADTILNLDMVNKFQNLEVLSLAGDKLKFDPSLIRVPHLRWMTIPSFVTQEEFNSLISTHRGLEVFEISDNDTISDLSVLGSLSKLCGLTVMDTLTDISTVRTLKNLKYLSLPSELLKDSTKRADWQQALPNTRIAANEGFCLGSGWLLLLIPFVLIIRLIFSRRNN